MFDKFPWTNAHQLNLNWIVKIISLLKGGSTGQIIRKSSSNNFDWEWVDVPGGGLPPDDNYNSLINKPSINGVELSGNKTSDDLLINKSYTNLTDKPSINGIELSGNKTSSDLLIDTTELYTHDLAFNGVPITSGTPGTFAYGANVNSPKNSAQWEIIALIITNISNNLDFCVIPRYYNEKIYCDFFRVSGSSATAHVTIRVVFRKI